MRNFYDTFEFIFTSQWGSEAIARNELAKITKPLDSQKLDKGTELLTTKDTFEVMFSKISPDNLIFVRHLQPVIKKSDLSKLPTIETELDFVSTYLLTEKKSFSVQVRTASKSSSCADISQKISEFLKSTGCVLNVTKPEMILSLFISLDNIYIGFSDKKHNLSDWPGGNIRFKKNDNTISRAEFKLLEVFSTFDININGTRALDLGAAPGGWSKILLEKGFSVTAVDPADLDKGLLQNDKLYHAKKTAQEFFTTNENVFDIIVNDMKMDALESADIINKSKKFLSEDGIVVLTLKLPNKNQQKKTYKVIDMLKNQFDILAARQLFHNRSEVTVVLKNKQ